MKSLTQLLPLLSLISPSTSHPLSQRAPSLHLPLRTSGRDILDSSSAPVLFAGTNWPGHQEAMIPEGLQYASISSIVAWLPRLGLNTVRLTYATEMIDDILSASPDQSLRATLIKALGPENGTVVLGQILANNPDFTAETTRLEVFDAVAREVAAQGIMLHLDNHVSKAGWCCGLNDGNGWFGEANFPVENWVRGWGYIAGHAAKNWPSFVGAGLRNELRDAEVAEPVDWYTWYERMTAAARAVHAAAPEALIFFSGLDYDTWIDPVPLGKGLNGTVGTATEGKTALFRPEDFEFKDKIVLELHRYNMQLANTPCPEFKAGWYQQGFQALDSTNPETKYLFPIVLTEWGFGHDDESWNKYTYNQCLIEMATEWKFGWMQWQIGGSYMLRQGTQDFDETWALLDHTWTKIRSQVTIDESIQKMIEALV
ncbi:Sterol 3-beta-glucosyltransferase [Sphaceloma murrayae]|uniref:Sterol 3-beta-glucosyltransferase n=1 Tax=Sphaceloma murrayae TaxID=2082308 RepID=A0A2K1QIW3_9PEZI|nr:Sterol 3-beta-glucosyltransferase [Sphaceloma murrayae]